MNSIEFDRILFLTAFSCMVCDGDIDKNEIKLLKATCENFPHLKNFNFEDEINSAIAELNEKGKTFIVNYLKTIENSDFTEEEELKIIDIAIQMIKADGKIEYSEIKFFKNIRRRLNVTNEIILQHFPDIEIFIEEDIIYESDYEKLLYEYFATVELPQFESIIIKKDDKEEKS